METMLREKPEEATLEAFLPDIAVGSPDRRAMSGGCGEHVGDGFEAGA
jgi:hypothetical protein